MVCWASSQFFVTFLGNLKFLYLYKHYIKEGKFQFFMELIKSFDFVKVDNEEDSKKEIIANLKEGFNEMKLYKEGKMKGTQLKDFLNEL